MPKTLTYSILSLENGLPLKTVLSKSIGLSRREISRLKFSKGLFINNVEARVTEIVKEKDIITMIFPEYDLAKASIILGKPDIVYEDEDLVIVNKPAGMPCHPSHEHLNDDMGTLLISYYNNQFPIRPIGRLDKDVSGLMIYAKNQLIASRLSKLRSTQQLSKYYLAIAQGVFTNKKDTITYHVTKKQGKHERQVSDDGQLCITEYEVIKEYNDLSLLKIHILTGRTHQIRVGMQSIGHTLVGDKLYGSLDRRIHRPALHCYCVDFVQPLSKQHIHIELPLPKDMQNLLEEKDEKTV